MLLQVTVNVCPAEFADIFRSNVKHTWLSIRDVLYQTGPATGILISFLPFWLIVVVVVVVVVVVLLLSSLLSLLLVVVVVVVVVVVASYYYLFEVCGNCPVVWSAWSDKILTCLYCSDTIPCCSILLFHVIQTRHTRN